MLVQDLSDTSVSDCIFLTGECIGCVRMRTKIHLTKLLEFKHSVVEYRPREQY